MSYIKSAKDVIKKINYILNRSQKRWGAIVLVCIMIGAIVETFGVSIIIPFVQALLSPDVIRENIPFDGIKRLLEEKTDIELIIILSIIVICIYIFKNIYLAFLSYIRAWYSCKVQKEVAVKMMNSYMRRGYPFFLKTNISELLRGVGGDVSGLYNVIFQIFKILTEGLTAVGICLFIMTTDILMALTVAGIGVFCVVLIVAIFKSRMSKYGKLYRRYIGITNKNSIQAFEGIKEILVTRREEYFKNNFEKAYQTMQSANVIHAVAGECPAYVIEGICVAGMVLMICIKVISSNDIESLIPQLAAYAIAAFRILPSLGRISSAFNVMIYSIPSLNATYENVYKANEFEKNTEEIKETEKSSIQFNDAIKIENVSWKYENNQKNILENVSFDIKKGTSTAFVGQSGAGKTTLADIILGLLHPIKGDVLVDGKSIFAAPDAWADMIGFVPQSVYLIDDTIRKNVAFGIDEDEIDDKKVWRALEQAQLADFVRKLPNGLDNVVGDKGVRISGGQRQRIAIARALYKEPEILVLDEATSALDTETESAVMDAIELLQGQKTLIIIAHRLTTIQNCDAVYEIKDGKAHLRRR